MITGMHTIIYSTDPAADLAFFSDVLGMPSVGGEDGWLVIKPPNAVLGTVPAGDMDNVHECYLMCEDITAFTQKMFALGHECSPVKDQPWGRLTYLTLPGGGNIGVCEPKHPLPTT